MTGPAGVRCGYGSQVGPVTLGERNNQKREGWKDEVQSSRSLGVGGWSSAFFFHGWGSRKPLGWHNLQDNRREKQQQCKFSRGQSRTSQRRQLPSAFDEFKPLTGRGHAQISPEVGEKKTGKQAMLRLHTAAVELVHTVTTKWRRATQPCWICKGCSAGPHLRVINYPGTFQFGLEETPTHQTHRGCGALASGVHQEDRGNNSFLFGVKEVDPGFTAAYVVHMWAPRRAPGSLLTAYIAWEDSVKTFCLSTSLFQEVHRKCYQFGGTSCNGSSHRLQCPVSVPKQTLLTLSQADDMWKCLLVLGDSWLPFNPDDFTAAPMKCPEEPELCFTDVAWTKLSEEERKKSHLIKKKHWHSCRSEWKEQGDVKRRRRMQWSQGRDRGSGLKQNSAN
ncbi:hypothetical protein INR49_026820, partial [Caranx melampygus]